MDKELEEIKIKIMLFCKKYNIKQFTAEALISNKINVITNDRYTTIKDVTFDLKK